MMQINTFLRPSVGADLSALSIDVMVSAFKSYSASSAPPIHPSIHGQTPLKKDTYRLGKNDVLLRTVHPQKSGYTSYEATHATSSEPCSHDTRSTATRRRNPHVWNAFPSAPPAGPAPGRAGPALSLGARTPAHRDRLCGRLSARASRPRALCSWRHPGHGGF